MLMCMINIFSAVLKFLYWCTKLNCQLSLPDQTNINHSLGNFYSTIDARSVQFKDFSLFLYQFIVLHSLVNNKFTLVSIGLVFSFVLFFGEHWTSGRAKIRDAIAYQEKKEKRKSKPFCFRENESFCFQIRNFCFFQLQNAPALRKKKFLIGHHNITWQLYIPDNITITIISNLLAKSLLRFKCISKPWLSWISDPKFELLNQERRGGAIALSYIKVMPLFRFLSQKILFKNLRYPFSKIRPLNKDGMQVYSTLHIGL